MSDQITMSGFEAPHEKERGVYKEILPQLEAAAREMGAEPGKIKLRPTKAYSSICYDTLLAFRLRIRGSSRYIEVPIASKHCVADIVPPNQQKAAGNFWRVALDDSSVKLHAAALANVLKDAINRFPKEWDCCSRYLECSNAKRCVHPDPTLSLVCGYRKILASGKIYYGENRNVD